MASLSRADILRLFEALNVELRKLGVRGDLYLAGGAVMCLAFGAREATRDVDAAFVPSIAVREAAVRVAAQEGVPDPWLNDAVKGYLSDHGSFDAFLERDHLRVFCADARYMLAMKCLAMRVGEGYRDEEDVRYLLRHLGLERQRTRWRSSGSTTPSSPSPPPRSRPCASCFPASRPERCARNRGRHRTPAGHLSSPGVGSPSSPGPGRARAVSALAPGARRRARHCLRRPRAARRGGRRARAAPEPRRRRPRRAAAAPASRVRAPRRVRGGRARDGGAPRGGALDERRQSHRGHRRGERRGARRPGRRELGRARGPAPRGRRRGADPRAGAAAPRSERAVAPRRGRGRRPRARAGAATPAGVAVRPGSGRPRGAPPARGDRRHGEPRAPRPRGALRARRAPARSGGGERAAPSRGGAPRRGRRRPRRGPGARRAGRPRARGRGGAPRRGPLPPARRLGPQSRDGRCAGLRRASAARCCARRPAWRGIPGGRRSRPPGSWPSATRR